MLLHGALAECDREARACWPAARAPSWSPVWLSNWAILPAPVPAGPVVSSRQGLGLAQQGEAPPKLSQALQRACQCEAELDGQPPGVAVLGQVRKGQGPLEGSHRLVVRGAVVALAPACWQ